MQLAVKPPAPRGAGPARIRIEPPPDLPLGARLARVAVAAAVLAVLPLVMPRVGMAIGWPIALTLFGGVVAVTFVPQQALLLGGLTGVAVLFQWVAVRAFAYHLILILAAFALRRRPRLLVAFLVVTVVLIPKELYRQGYHEPFFHDWLNPFLLAHFFLVVLLWLVGTHTGRVGPTSFSGWLGYVLFPGHPINPMNFSPGDVARARTAGPREVGASVLVLASKVLGLAALAYLWPHLALVERPAAQLLGASTLDLWRSTLVSYLICALTLSGTADVAILVARLFGWPLPHSFRWALLAWNPVELWRRWAIYNRKLLLTLVYFPLGGNARHRTLNVMLTFAASGLVLHSGWLGSKYWEAGAAGWRDQTIYFLLQGLAVSACLALWRWRGKDPSADRQLRWSWGRVLGVAGTQALSAWLHILVLAPQLSLGERARVMARCLGL